MRSIWISGAFAALSLATSEASAQGVDQDTRQQIEKLVAAYHDDWNNHDAAGIAGLYTNEGVLVTQAPKVVKAGQQEIEQNYKNAFNTIPHHDSATVHQLSSLGTDALMSVGEYHLTGQGQGGPTKIDGHWTAVYVRENGAWKIRLLTAVPDLPSTPPAR